MAVPPVVLRVLSIRRRLMALSAVGVLMIVGVGATGVLGLGRAATVAEAMESQATVHELTARSRNDALTLVAREKELLVVSQTNEAAKLHRDFAARQRALRDILVELESRVDNEPDRAAVAAMRSHLDAYILATTRTQERQHNGPPPEDSNPATAAARQMRGFLTASEQLAGRAREQQRAGRVELSRLSDQLAALLAAATTLMAALAMVLGATIHRSISRPLVATLNALEAVAKGDLDQRLELGHSDEMGRIATSLTTAIQRMKTDRDQIERLATTDALTGLTNRRAFSETVALELSRARRYGFRLALLLFDLDHFKKINDRFGHAAGDLVLSRVGQLIHGQIRTSDIAARWGGEEFVVALPHVGIDGAAVVAARIRIACQDLEITTDKGQRIPITISIGVAEMTREDTLHSLAERADHAMYKAKREGRNRVFVNDGTVLSMPPTTSSPGSSRNGG